MTTLWVAAAALAVGGVSMVTGAQRATYTIAFGSFEPVRPTVFIAEGNGAHANRLLAIPGVDYNASFSLDGAWIVFTSERGGSPDIYRIHPDGFGFERLTDDRASDDQGALSPDGRMLAFVSTRGGAANIWLRDLATRALMCLTQGSIGDFRPAWSPDGEWIAFSSHRDDIRRVVTFTTIQATNIYIMRRTGRFNRQIDTVEEIGI